MKKSNDYGITIAINGDWIVEPLGKFTPLDDITAKESALICTLFSSGAFFFSVGGNANEIIERIKSDPTLIRHFC